MSAATRRELLKHVQERYKKASWRDKGKILDEFCTLTSYGRKYAISLFNSMATDPPATKAAKRLKKKKYDEATRQALLTLWHAGNRICSKRLVPFIPELLSALERFGHISLPEDVRAKLLMMSPATADRLLDPERREGKKGLCTTRSGTLLKHQIKIRTFADWNSVIPGFLEGDLVAHCGDKVEGSYLNTLVITDIATGWTEFFPILVKGEANVIAALKVAQEVLPFVLLGLDTDNGSEFINYALLKFCKENAITFTRSRAYRKNDQAHVEEKNGSIVRRLIGYDRYEGLNAYNALSALYAVLRLYVNFFQPSLKLLSKKRDGAKVTKKYDKAKTPYQRLILSTHFTESDKEKLKKQYDGLDPIGLLNNLVKLQDSFWKHAWSAKDSLIQSNIIVNASKELIEPQSNETESVRSNSTDINNKNIIDAIVDNEQLPNIHRTPGDPTQSPSNIRRYRRSKRPRKELEPRTWLTREDGFVSEWGEIKIQLELNPTLTATSLLKDLAEKKPEEFNISQLRTLQRRVSKWRLDQLRIHQKMQYPKNTIEDKSAEVYISLVTQAIANG